MHLVIFDIDGTLIRSFDDDVFITAIEEYFGLSIKNRDWTTYPHVTDWGVIEKTFQDTYGKPVTMEELRAAETYYGNALKAYLDRNPTSVVPLEGCREFVNSLISMGHALAVATGGFRVSARMKLEAAGLSASFPVLASSTDHISRTSILELAAERAKSHLRQSAFSRITYFGDAIWDYQTTSKLGWDFVGIGTDIQRLAEAGAERVFPDYADTERLFQQLNS